MGWKDFEQEEKNRYQVNVHLVNCGDFRDYLYRIEYRIVQQEKGFEYFLKDIHKEFSQHLLDYNHWYRDRISDYKSRTRNIQDIYHSEQDKYREELKEQQTQLKAFNKSERRKLAKMYYTLDEDGEITRTTPTPFASGRQEAEIFIEEFEMYLQRCQVPDVADIQIHLLKHFLHGPALQWLQPILTHPERYIEFYEDFYLLLDEFSRVFTGHGHD